MGLVYADADKAEAFADSFERQCRENEVDLTDEVEDTETHADQTIRRLRRTDDTDILLEPTSPEEIKTIIRHAKTRKAPGPDHIPVRALKALPRKGLAALTNIINAILRLRHFPSSWKEATVIMIPKPNKNHTFPQNHRPISLTPAMSKVAERVIQTRLEAMTEELNVLPDEQFGFRHEHSTELQVTRIVDATIQSWNRTIRGHFTGAVFLDVSKAFDRVWHDGLVTKLVDAGYSTPMVKLINSFIRGRHYRCKVGKDVLSSRRRLEAGVPQGAVLSPHLFSIYTADMPKADNPMTKLALYADDTAIFAESMNERGVTTKLQRQISMLEPWFNKWKIGINADKSKAILFTRRRRTPAGQLTMNGDVIPWVDEAVYLGVTLDKKLTFQRHVTHRLALAKAARHKLWPLIGRSSNMALELKLRLIKTILLPIMLYASTAWGQCAHTYRHRIQTFFNVCLRMATDAPRYMPNRFIYRDLDIHPDYIDRQMRNHAGNTLNRVETHTNPLLTELRENRRERDDRDKYRRPVNQVDNDTPDEVRRRQELRRRQRLLQQGPLID